MLKAVALAGAMMVAGTAAKAADACQSYVGTVVQPQSFDAVALLLKGLPGIKGEFETTADFQARVQAARAKLPEHIIIRVPVNSKYVEYDADAGAFKIKSYAIDNENTDYYGTFGYGTPFYEKVKIGSTGSNLDIVVSTVDVPQGTYVGTNSFGASARIAKVARTTKAIFDRAEARYDEDLFPGLVGNVLFTIPVAAAQAPAMKSGFRAAVVVAPYAPFYVLGKGMPGDVTLDNPVDLSETMQIIMADRRPSSRRRAECRRRAPGLRGYRR
jgi:hypothetical protein